MALKNDFNRNGSETYASKQEALQKRADNIEKMLNTPRNPQPQLKPKGELRTLGDKHARQQLQQRRVDIFKELDQLKKERAQTKQPELEQKKSL